MRTKHIKAMISRAIREPTDNQKQPSSSDTLNQIVQALKKGPDYPYDLMRLACSTWPEGSHSHSGLLRGLSDKPSMQRLVKRY
jgi:hypothetical protein